MIRKLFIVGLVLAVCLELSQGKPSLQAKTMEDYSEALIQGMYVHDINIIQALSPGSLGGGGGWGDSLVTTACTCGNLTDKTL